MTVRFPTASDFGGDLFGMVLSELRLCKVARQETAVIFTDTRTNPNYASAFLAAAKELAGSVFELKMPFLPDNNGRDTDLEPVLNIIKSAHFVVDLSTGGVLFIYSQGLADVLAGGTRVLQGKGTEEQLRRCFPNEDLRRRTLKGAEWLERSTEIRVVSDGGTDLRIRKEGRKAVTQYGISDVPGRWDSWPSGFLYCAPQEETANGTLVLDVGDLLVMLGRYVRQPVRLTVEQGKLIEIEGGVDAMLLKARLDQARDPEAFMISHIGWGTDPRARWTEVAQRGTEEGARDARSTYGNVQIAFGANYALGGQNKTKAHEDLIMRHATFYLDGKVVVEGGEIVPEDLR